MDRHPDLRLQQRRVLDRVAHAGRGEAEAHERAELEIGLRERGDRGLHVGRDVFGREHVVPAVGNTVVDRAAVVQVTRRVVPRERELLVAVDDEVVVDADRSADRAQGAEGMRCAGRIHVRVARVGVVLHRRDREPRLRVRRARVEVPERGDRGDRLEPGELDDLRAGVRSERGDVAAVERRPCRKRCRGDQRRQVEGLEVRARLGRGEDGNAQLAADPGRVVRVVAVAVPDEDHLRREADEILDDERRPAGNRLGAMHERVEQDDVALHRGGERRVGEPREDHLAGVDLRGALVDVLGAEHEIAGAHHVFGGGSLCNGATPAAMLLRATQVDRKRDIGLSPSRGLVGIPAVTRRRIDSATSCG